MKDSHPPEDAVITTDENETLSVHMPLTSLTCFGFWQNGQNLHKDTHKSHRKVRITGTKGLICRERSNQEGPAVSKPSQI